MNRISMYNKNSLRPVASFAFLQNMWHRLIDLIYPPMCIHCGRVGQLLCEQCMATIQPVPVTGLRPELARSFAGFSAIGYHADILKAIVHALKFENSPRLAEPAGRLLAHHIQTLDWKPEAVIPVPLHPERLQERGYNQANCIAQTVGKYLQLPVYSEALVKIHHTRTQVGLSAIERRENVQDSFHLVQPLKEQRILLVDDVCTTGSTLAACAETLVTTSGTLPIIYAATVTRATGDSNL